MDIEDAVRIITSHPVVDAQRRALIRELESEAEAARMAIKEFTCQANEAKQKVARYEQQLKYFTEQLRGLGVLIP